MKIIHVVGARPNFMKIAPIMREMDRYPDEFQQILVHTGQHYDDKMSKVFFDELELPNADINLSVGSGTHACQTAQVMMRFEPVVLEQKPDWVFVPGDVNSTLACALVCSKLDVRVAHVEAGLRSFDRTMPEEINRILTDQISDLLFTPSRDGDDNLLREGVQAEKIHFVGNVMIDTLVRLLPKAEARWRTMQEQYGREYILATLHRPSNVDDPSQLTKLLDALVAISQKVRVVFPVHPRTRQRIGEDFDGGNITFIDPLGYLDFIAVQAHAKAVITDSGGVQEETSYLGVPCFTLRANTERPITVTQGSNRLVSGPDQLEQELHAVLSQQDHVQRSRPEYWDGRTSQRIVQVMRG
jgi:UDP-N-acetylglucosamine 2-epimerase (non-hydrolysing)